MSHEIEDDQLRKHWHMDDLPIEALELWQALNAAVSDAHHRGVPAKVISDTAEKVFRNAHAEASVISTPSHSRP